VPPVIPFAVNQMMHDFIVGKRIGLIGLDAVFEGLMHAQQTHPAHFF
jgi:hypothetical protein